MVPRTAAAQKKSVTVEERDAVCFTAGTPDALFGISLGALSVLSVLREVAPIEFGRWSLVE